VQKNQSSIDADKLKGVLITRTAIKTLVPEDIVEKVIMFQFKDARDAMVDHEQVEISGFGKFMTSPNKIRRKIQKLEILIFNMEAKLKDRPEEIRNMETWNNMMEKLKATVAYMKTKKGGYENKS